MLGSTAVAIYFIYLSALVLNNFKLAGSMFLPYHLHKRREKQAGKYRVKVFHGYLSIKDYGNASLNLQACNYISLYIFKALATVLLAQQVTTHT